MFGCVIIFFVAIVAVNRVSNGASSLTDVSLNCNLNFTESVMKKQGNTSYMALKLLVNYQITFEPLMFEKRSNS